MIEGDVVYGTYNKTNATIMAHPPHNESDLLLEDFILDIMKDGKRGIKLDFKTIEAFNSSLEILKKYRVNVSTTCKAIVLFF